MSLGQRPRSQLELTVCVDASYVQLIISFSMVGFENCSAQITIKPRQGDLYKNHVATLKAKFTVSTYSSCIGLNETYLCPANNFVVGPASGMVRYRDRVFHPFVRSHQGVILLKALGGGISVLWTHLFLVESFSMYFYGLNLGPPASELSWNKGHSFEQNW